MKVIREIFNEKQFTLTENLQWWRMADMKKVLAGGTAIYTVCKVAIEKFPDVEVVRMFTVDGKEQQFFNPDNLRSIYKGLLDSEENKKPIYTANSLIKAIDIYRETAKAVRAEIKAEKEDEDVDLLALSQELHTLENKIFKIKEDRKHKKATEDELSKAKEIIAQLREANLQIVNERDNLRREVQGLREFKNKVLSITGAAN